WPAGLSSLSLSAEVDVAVLAGVGIDEAELLRRARLDAPGRELTRELGGERGVLGMQLVALGVRRVEREIQLEHRHIHEYDAREQNRADRDPEDPAACAALPASRARARRRPGGRTPDRLGDNRL